MTDNRRACSARQYSDQMCCGRCAHTWDMNDPEPPGCLTDEEVNRRRGRETLDQLKERLNR